MKPRAYKFNTLLEIEWLDIVDNTEWLTLSKAKKAKPCLCKSAGYFLCYDKTVIRISSSIQIEDSDRGVTVIPWGTIKSIKSHPARIRS